MNSLVDTLFDMLQVAPRDKPLGKSSGSLASRGDTSLMDTIEPLYNKLIKKGTEFDDVSNLNDFKAKYGDDVKALNGMFEIKYNDNENDKKIKKAFKDYATKQIKKNGTGAPTVKKESVAITTNDKTGRKSPTPNPPPPTPPSPTNPKSKAKRPPSHPPLDHPIPTSPASSEGPFEISKCKFIQPCHGDTLSDLPEEYISLIGTRAWYGQGKKKTYYPILIIHPGCVDVSNSAFQTWKFFYDPSNGKWSFMFIWYGQDTNCFGFHSHKSIKQQTVPWDRGLERKFPSKLGKGGIKSPYWESAIRDDGVAREARGEEFLSSSDVVDRWKEEIQDDSDDSSDDNSDSDSDSLKPQTKPQNNVDPETQRPDLEPDSDSDSHHTATPQQASSPEHEESDDESDSDDDSTNALKGRVVAVAEKKQKSPGEKLKRHVNNALNKGLPLDWTVEYQDVAKKYFVIASDGTEFKALGKAREYAREVNPDFEPRYDENLVQSLVESRGKTDKSHGKKDKKVAPKKAPSPKNASKDTVNEAEEQGFPPSWTVKKQAGHRRVTAPDGKAFDSLTKGKAYLANFKEEEPFSPDELKKIANELKSASASRVVELLKELTTKRIRNVNKEVDFLPNSETSIPKYLKSISKKFKTDEGAYKRVKEAFDSLKDKIHADHAQEQEKEVVSKPKSKPKPTKPAEKPAEEKPLEEKPAEKPAEKDPTAIPKRAKNAMPKKKIDRTSSPREFGTTGGSYHPQPGAVQRPHSSTHSSTHTSYGNNFNSKSISIGNTTTTNNNKRTHDSLNPPLQSPPSGVGRSTSAAAAVQAPTTKIRRVLSEQTQKKAAKVETPQKASFGKNLVTTLKQITTTPIPPSADYRADAASLLCSSVIEKIKDEILAKSFSYLLEAAIFKDCLPSSSSSDAMEVNNANLSTDTKYDQKIRLTALALTGTINTSKLVGMKLQAKVFAGHLSYEELAKMSVEQLETEFLREMPITK